MENLQGLGSWSMVLACCGFQSELVGRFIIKGPSLTMWVDSLEVNFVKRFLSCPVEPILNFGLMQGFNGLLALICFMFTFMAPKPVRQYNFSRDITIASLIYCVIWVIFIPIYAGLGDKKKTQYRTHSQLSPSKVSLPGQGARPQQKFIFRLDLRGNPTNTT